jgi:hypothetical protein
MKTYDGQEITVAFEDGMNAWKEGKGLMDNPYDTHSDEHNEWISGFLYQRNECR